MISSARALRLIEQAARRDGPLPAERAPLARALGRVAAEAVFSAEPLPPFDNSAMDGYAVSASATASARPGHPVRLPLLGAICAGDPPLRGRRVRGAYEIMTGAPVPRGFDAVVKIEDASLADSGRAVEFASPARPGDFVRRSGQDFAPGLSAIEAGTPLGPGHLLALAALGHDRIAVRRKPLVSVLSTGRELAPAGRTPLPGQIRNATAAYLLAALARCGARARYHGVVRDDPADFRRRLAVILRGAPDAIVTTGAVSMGRHDFIAAELARLGADVLFHKVAIRPGKPGLVARLPDGPLVFGMPGNPVSTVVAYRFFLLPYLRRRLGLPAERPLRARLSAAAEKPAGLRCFYKARLSSGPGGLTAEVLAGQASFQIRPLLAANAWVVLPEGPDRVPRGAVVDVHPAWPDGEGGA